MPVVQANRDHFIRHQSCYRKRQWRAGVKARSAACGCTPKQAAPAFPSLRQSRAACSRSIRPVAPRSLHVLSEPQGPCRSRSADRSSARVASVCFRRKYQTGKRPQPPWPCRPTPPAPFRIRQSPSAPPAISSDCSKTAYSTPLRSFDAKNHPSPIWISTSASIRRNAADRRETVTRRAWSSAVARRCRAILHPLRHLDRRIFWIRCATHLVRGVLVDRREQNRIERAHRPKAFRLRRIAVRLELAAAHHRHVGIHLRPERVIRRRWQMRRSQQRQNPARIRHGRLHCDCPCPELRCAAIAATLPDSRPDRKAAGPTPDSRVRISPNRTSGSALASAYAHRPPACPEPSLPLNVSGSIKSSPAAPQKCAVLPYAAAISGSALSKCRCVPGHSRNSKLYLLPAFRKSAYPYRVNDARTRAQAERPSRSRLSGFGISSARMSAC